MRAIGAAAGLITLLTSLLLPGLALAAVGAPGVAQQPSAGGPALVWAIPFLGMLASIAVLPMLAEAFWHHRMGLVAAFWSLALLLPQAIATSPDAAADGLTHAVLVEYLPFVALLLALFTAAGGLLVTGGPRGTPWGNTTLLAVGTALAGVMGTTGAAMVLIHPLLRANAHRRGRRHIVVFFMVLVANVGGATTPLGDPPLYLGFLRGVPFAWPLRHLTLPMLVIAGVLLAAFFLIDRSLAAAEPPAPSAAPLRVEGRVNAGLIALVVLGVLGQGLWHPGNIVLLGQTLPTERVVGVLEFLAVAAISIAVTPRRIREANLFDWAPIVEVAKLFIALFITISPVMHMLDAGLDGPFAPLLQLTLNADGQPAPLAYFWLTGVLSAFLDNAPTYLVFFELAGGDPARLTGALQTTLVAISAGAVFFGGLTYIGNAPNLMIRTIASERGVRMPSFFGLMLLTGTMLLPCFLLISAIFFR